jgi:hypothetical protein
MRSTKAMRSSRRKITVAALFACCLPILAQAGATGDVGNPGAPTFRIAGHIVSAVDGHPLQRATVEIEMTKTYKLVASVVSDEFGAFAFENVKGGKYVLQGKSPGYIQSRLQEHNGFSTAVTSGEGVDTEALELKLMPEAELHGRVTDETGEGMRHTSVVLYRETAAADGVHIRRQRNAQTDDNGDYAIAGLAPGRYFVAATGRPWYAVHPPAAQQQNAYGIVDSVDPTLDVAYPLTFYPDTTDSSNASPIQLKPGDQVEADVRLSPRPAVSISIPRKPGEQNGGAPMLQQEVFGNLEPLNGQEYRGNQNENTIVGVPPGKYVLREQNPQAGGTSHTMMIDAAGHSVLVDMARAAELGGLKVVLRMPSGSKLPPPARVSLNDGESVAATGFVNEKEDAAQVSGVKPGDYRLVVYGGQKQYFVAGYEVGGKVIAGDHLHVAEGASPTVTVIALPGRATVEGFARLAGKPRGGALVLLLPTSELPHAELSWVQQSDLDGSFDLANVPAGSYTLLAIDDGWGLEWRKPEVLARYVAKGVPVVVGEGGSATVRLPGPLEVQAK